MVENSDTLEIAVGSKISLTLWDGTARTFEIVTPRETKPEDGRISYESPLGKALLGKRKGDKATYQVDDKEFTVQVLDVW